MSVWLETQGPGIAAADITTQETQGGQTLGRALAGVTLPGEQERENAQVGQGPQSSSPQILFAGADVEVVKEYSLLASPPRLLSLLS